MIRDDDDESAALSQSQIPEHLLKPANEVSLLISSVPVAVGVSSHPFCSMSLRTLSGLQSSLIFFLPPLPLPASPPLVLPPFNTTSAKNLSVKVKVMMSLSALTLARLAD